MSWEFNGVPVPVIHPCPFCNSQSVTGTEEESHDVEAGGMPDIEQRTSGWAVSCNNPECQATGPTRGEPGDAIEWWNRGVKSPHPPGPLRRFCESGGK